MARAMTIATLMIMTPRGGGWWCADGERTHDNARWNVSRNLDWSPFILRVIAQERPRREGPSDYDDVVAIKSRGAATSPSIMIDRQSNINGWIAGSARDSFSFGVAASAPERGFRSKSRDSPPDTSSSIGLACEMLFVYYPFCTPQVAEVAAHDRLFERSVTLPRLPLPLLLLVVGLFVFLCLSLGRTDGRRPGCRVPSFVLLCGDVSFPTERQAELPLLGVVVCL